jgi:hypothetical protein
MKKETIRVGTKVEYLGKVCTVTNICGSWLNLVADENKDIGFVITKGFVKVIKE